MSFLKEFPSAADGIDTGKSDEESQNVNVSRYWEFYNIILNFHFNL